MTIRVLLADDQALIRGGFAALIDSADDLAVAGEAIDGADAVRQARALRPDVVLMDVRMPGVDGLTACEQITADPALVGRAIDEIAGACRAGQPKLALAQLSRLVPEFDHDPHHAAARGA